MNDVAERIRAEDLLPLRNGNNLESDASIPAVRLPVPVVLLFFCLIGCGTQQTQPSNRQLSEVAHRPTSVRKQITFGDSLQQAKIISYSRPKYPHWALRERLQGTVELRADIGKDGKVWGLAFVSGPKGLAPYAETAVRKWRYQPLILNGTPVEFKIDILVPFILPKGSYQR